MDFISQLEKVPYLLETRRRGAVMLVTFVASFIGALPATLVVLGQ